MFLFQSQKDVEKETYYLQLVRQNRVDGIIGITFHKTGLNLSADVPMVMIDRHLQADCCCISSDNFHGGELAVQRLTAGGSRRLLFLRTGSRLHSETLKRGQGFESECKKQGVCYEMKDFGDDADSYHEAEIYRYFQEKMRGGTFSFDGIYASTDGLALSILELLDQLGIQVPEQVQVIGHDGLRRMNKGPYLLSTIVQPVEEMAGVSVKTILKLIHKEQADPLVILPVTFAEGGTTRKISDAEK